MNLVCIAAVTGLLAIAVAVAAQPPPAETSLDRLCLVHTIGNIDATQEGSDSFPNDVMAAQGSLSQGVLIAFYGLSKPFSGLRFDVGTAGVGGDLSWSYYNGLGWEPISLRKGQELATFDETGVTSMEFKRPDDWTPRPVQGECGASMYYIKSSTGNAYDVVPLLDQVWATN